ncbi:DUF6566 family protein [Paraburkholderia sp. SIMBA_009]|uniref:DUF6566 family protein n=1 Tax=Paraburkholderia tropica TaxID=92647 RepID=UPI000944C691|nr:DUF6566 family protein [Paraburkholderia tropica]RQN36245.1 hypothetical protein EHZ25_24830 [Paraburkholderia tropica]
MDNVHSGCECWKGFDIETRAFPVRHWAPVPVPDSYVAVVRIRRDGHVTADWHLPRYAPQWRSADEARRDAVGYAIRAINAGCINSGGSPACVGA